MKMEQVISQFRPRPGFSMRSEIKAYLRGLIANGEIPAGSKLPPTWDIAKAWCTHPPTVHAAMTALVKEGLVLRLMGRGTFVREQNESLRNVALYISGDRWVGKENRFVGHLMHLLTDQLAADGVRAQPWIARRTQAAAAQPWEELELAAKRREIQGMIVAELNPQEAPWLMKLPVPVVFLANELLPNRVWMTMTNEVRQSIAALASRNLRSVGLITVLSPLTKDAAGGKTEEVEFHEQFRQLAQEHKLEVRDSWMCSPPTWLPEKAAAKFGFESFHALWNQPEKPDSLLVFTDVAAQGVLMALGQRQVRVPENLHLVLHRNVEMGLFCPVPASFIDVSVQNVAAALVDLLQRIHRGETVEQPVKVAATYVAESAAAESDVLETAALAG